MRQIASPCVSVGRLDVLMPITMPFAQTQQVIKSSRRHSVSFQAVEERWLPLRDIEGIAVAACVSQMSATLLDRHPLITPN